LEQIVSVLAKTKNTPNKNFDLQSDLTTLQDQILDIQNSITAVIEYVQAVMVNSNSKEKS